MSGESVKEYFLHPYVVTSGVIHFWICDTEADLPETGNRSSDLAYTIDTGALWVFTTSWVNLVLQPDLDALQAEVDALEATGHPSLAVHDALGLATDTELADAIVAAINAHIAAIDPHDGYELSAMKGTAFGYASLNGSAKVPILELPTGTGASEVASGDHNHNSAYEAAGAVTTHAGNEDAHHTENHAARHAAGAADELKVADLSSGVATDGQLPYADGAGGIAWGEPPAGAGGMPVRRDQPEIVIPDGANFISHLTGVTDTLPTYTQIDASSDADYLIIGAQVGIRFGSQVATGGVPVSVFEEHLLRARIGTGAASSEVSVGEFLLGGAVFYSVLNPQASTSVGAFACVAQHYDVGPRLVAAGTRLSFSCAWLGTPATAVRNVRVALLALPGDFVPLALPFSYEDYFAGTVVTETLATDLAQPTKSTTSWADGSWVTAQIKGSDTADQDYIVTGAYLVETSPGSNTPVDTVFEFGVGAAAAEVVQARSAKAGLSAAADVPFYHRFRVPFQLFSGERLSVRCRGNGTSAIQYDVRLTLEAVPLS